MQRDKYIQERARFCKLALNDQKRAARELRELAIGLENCRNTTDVITALQTIFCVSERTVFNDIKT